MHCSRSRWCRLVIAVISFPALLHPQDQQFRFKRLSVREGLSQSTVNTIAQDSAGFLWFGTQDGLNRYDGYTFRIFSGDPSDTNSLSNNYVWKLLAGRHGDLWVGTYSGGLDRFDPSTEEFRHYRHNAADPRSLSSNSVVALCEDDEGTLWAGTWGGGLNHLQGPSGQFTSYQHHPADQASISDDRISCIVKDRKGYLWVGTWNGLNKFDPRTGMCTRYMHQKRTGGSISDNAVWSLYEDQSGILWIGTWGGGLDRYDPVQDRFEHFRRFGGPRGQGGTDRVTGVIEDERGNYWISTSSAGLMLLDARRQSITSVKHDPNDPESLSDDNVMTLFRDRKGGIWCGTFGGGISGYNRLRNQFPRFNHRTGDTRSLSQNVVRAFCEDTGGNLWVGTTGGGINVLAAGSESFIHYRHQKNDPGTLPSDGIVSLWARRNGEIWAGTLDCGAVQYLPGEKRFVQHAHDGSNPRTISHNSVMTLFEDREGTLWLGTSGAGLDRYDDRTRSFIHYVRLRDDSVSISGNSIWSLAEDNRGNLWVGTWGRGCSRFDRATGTFDSYYPDPADPSSLANNTVLCMAQDPGGRLWLGTEGGGLNEYDYAKRRFRHITESDGLPSNVVYGILPDTRGNLWISTTRGLCVYSPGTGTFHTFDADDGLQSSEFNQGAYFRRRGGQFCFGGIEGFNMFYPDSVRQDTSPPPVVLTSFKVFERPIRAALPISAAQPLVVTYDQSYLSFEFAALDFTAPDHHRYAYKLDGFDREWINAGTRHYAGYTRLEGGEYVLRIRASNKDAIWNMTGIAIPLRVIPPYWKTWWFRALSGITLLFLIYALHRYRVSQLLALERLRVRIASDLHDDIGSSLTRIAAQSEIIRHTDDRMKIKAASTRIGSISREIIATLGDLVWSIDARNDTLGNLVDRMRENAEETLSAEGIHVTLEHEGLPMNTQISVDVRQNLYLIFKEAITNIARHSRAGEARIRLTNGYGRFTMAIRDDGCGPGETVKRTGHGMRNMQMRAERIKAKLAIDSTKGLVITLSMKEL